MKKLLISVLSVVLIFGGSVVLSGCAKESNLNIGFVVGNTANSPLPKYLFESDEELSDNVKQLIESNNVEKMHFNSVAPSGIWNMVSNNKEESSLSINTNCYNMLYDMKEEDRDPCKKNNLEQVPLLMSNTKPQSNGADYFDSILDMINTQLKIVPGNDIVDCSEYKIYVLGSGLSDTGSLNFAENDYLFNNPQDIVSNFLKNNKPEVKFSDSVTIKFIGLGSSVLPQQTLDSNKIKIVEDIYKGIFGKDGFGFSVETIPFAPGQGDELLDTDGYSVNSTPIEPCKEIQYTIGENQIKFIDGSSSEFADKTPPSKVLETLNGIANVIKKNNATVTIQGFESRDFSEDTKTTKGLTKGRANYIKTLLVDNFHINASQIKPEGKGFGTYKQKGYSEFEKSKNRVVKIIIQPRNCNK
jgi:hypothetical protein